MHLLMITGRRTNKTTYIRALVEFLIEHSKLKQNRWNLAINPLKGKIAENNAGVVTHDDEGIAMFIRMEESPFEMAITIAHEFVHVRQIARGLLRHEKVNGKHMIRWRGKLYGEKELPFIKRP